jgi:hypothetical protein
MVKNAAKLAHGSLDIGRHPNMSHSHAWFRDLPHVKFKLEPEL